MKRLLIAAVAVAGLLTASCSSDRNPENQNADSTLKDTVPAQTPGDSVRLADSAVNRADHVKVDSAE